MGKVLKRSLDALLDVAPELAHVDFSNIKFAQHVLEKTLTLRGFKLTSKKRANDVEVCVSRDTHRQCYRCSSKLQALVVATRWTLAEFDEKAHPREPRALAHPSLRA